MKTTHWMLAAILTLCGTAVMNSCKDSGNGSTDGQKVENEADAVEADVIEAQPETYLTAIDRYMVDTIGSCYTPGEQCIPCAIVVWVDSAATDDIKVWGDFWVFNYNQEGDTLKCVSGGNHPGLMHLTKGEYGYEVVAFDAVGDGSEFLPTAQRIFGSRFNDFKTVQADENMREQARAAAIADYVRRNHLKARFYQDHGWPAKPLPGSAPVK